MKRFIIIYIYHFISYCFSQTNNLVMNPSFKYKGTFPFYTNSINELNNDIYFIHILNKENSMIGNARFIFQP